MQLFVEEKFLVFLSLPYIPSIFFLSFFFLLYLCELGHG